MSSLLCLLRLWLSLYGGLHPDEAYYWAWAQNIHLGYYDHPPLIAYIIRLGQEIFEVFWGSNYSGAKNQLFFSFRWLPDLIGYILSPWSLRSRIPEKKFKLLTSLWNSFNPFDFIWRSNHYSRPSSFCCLDSFIFYFSKNEKKSQKRS